MIVFVRALWNVNCISFDNLPKKCANGFQIKMYPLIQKISKKFSWCEKYKMDVYPELLTTNCVKDGFNSKSADCTIHGATVTVGAHGSSQSRRVLSAPSLLTGISDAFCRCCSHSHIRIAWTSTNNFRAKYFH